MSLILEGGLDFPSAGDFEKWAGDLVEVSGRKLEAPMLLPSSDLDTRELGAKVITDGIVQIYRMVPGELRAEIMSGFSQAGANLISKVAGFGGGLAALGSVAVTAAPWAALVAQIAKRQIDLITDDIKKKKAESIRWLASLRSNSPQMAMVQRTLRPVLGVTWREQGSFADTGFVDGRLFPRWTGIRRTGKKGRPTFTYAELSPVFPAAKYSPWPFAPDANLASAGWCSRSFGQGFPMASWHDATEAATDQWFDGKTPNNACVYETRFFPLFYPHVNPWVPNPWAGESGQVAMMQTLAITNPSFNLSTRLDDVVRIRNAAAKTLERATNGKSRIKLERVTRTSEPVEKSKRYWCDVKRRGQFGEGSTYYISSKGTIEKYDLADGPSPADVGFKMHRMGVYGSKWVSASAINTIMRASAMFIAARAAFVSDSQLLETVAKRIEDSWTSHLDPAARSILEGGPSLEEKISEAERAFLEARQKAAAAERDRQKTAAAAQAFEDARAEAAKREREMQAAIKAVDNARAEAARRREAQRLAEQAFHDARAEAAADSRAALALEAEAENALAEEQADFEEHVKGRRRVVVGATALGLAAGAAAYALVRSRTEDDASKGED